MEQESPVLRYYNGAHVLITGGTGFLGRILMEKLLRVCPGVERVYLIIRTKKDVQPTERFAQLFHEPVFGPLRELMPDFHKKIMLIPGDCGEIGLGLSDEDRLLLISKITHVFHGAATVRFDAPLKRAIQLNVRGVREILLLSKDCPNLKSFVHISTAYVNCPIKEIDEKFYKSPLSFEQAVELIEILNDVQLEAITPELIKPWPNTYSFSKIIAEDIIDKFRNVIPIAIARPSIVIGCNKEPIPGWIDNIYGPTGILVAAGVGLMRTMYCHREKKADMVPVDMTVNGIICAAWNVGQKSSTTADKGLPIYNFVAAKENILKWDGFRNLTMNQRNILSFSQAIWYPSFTLTSNWTMFLIQTFFYHTIPGYIMDAAFLLLGKKPKVTEAYRKIKKFNEVLAFFSMQEWTFIDNNARNLWDKLNPDDQRLFDFNFRGVNWPEYFSNNIQAIRTYCLKDPLSTIPFAQKKTLILGVAHYSILAAIYSLLAWLIYYLALNSYPPVLSFSLVGLWWALTTIYS